MKLVHADEIPWDSANLARGAESETRPLLRGEPGLGNFAFTLWRHSEGYANPRHRHNFAQFRYQLEGVDKYGKDGEMTPGTLGYFPEGAYYGPQSGAHIVIALQFDGASGRGYMARSQMQNAMAELKTMGVFEKGVYTRNEGVEGPRNQDAMEAMWEHEHKRKLVYPERQYGRWILMDTNNYPWIPTGEDGVSERAFGTFSSAKIRAASYKLQATSRLTVDGRGIYMVLSGQGTVEGQSYREQTGVYLGDDEQATYIANEPTEILLLGLPSYAYLHTIETAQAEATGELAVTASEV